MDAEEGVHRPSVRDRKASVQQRTAASQGVGRKATMAEPRALVESRAAREGPVEREAPLDSSPAVELTPGMQVRVKGLERARQHNDKEGVLITPIITAEHGSRWNIRMLSGELLALKPENLEPCASAPSVQAMVDALERAGEHDKAALLRSMIPDHAN